MEKPNWEKLEILVTKIQRSLAPDANVQHNVSMYGFASEVNRQVDVLVSQKIGQYEIKVVIDCKDYKKPVDVKGVEEFIGLVKDVGANKGAMVCPKGFSQAAKTFAKKKGIELYSPIDTDPHKWQVKITAPVICKARYTKVSFGLRFSLPLPFKMPYTFYNESIIYDKDKRALGTAQKIFGENWNQGNYPIDVGTHENLDLINHQQCFMDNGYGQIVPVHLYISTTVYEECYFGHVPITDISGLKDEQTGLIHTRELTTKIISPDEILKTWQKLNNKDELPAKALFELVMTEYFQMS